MNIQIHTASNGAKFPYYAPDVHHTRDGRTPYLREPGFAIISQPQFAIEPVGAFLAGFDDSLGFDDYLEDDWESLDPSTAVCKVAGQLCYMSFDEKRTKNADVKKYFDNIKSSKHGSVFEHANVSILLWGDSRSLTHELVRHRVGVGYSQLSQRYVDGPKLRFVERPEYQNHDHLHVRFERFIDSAKSEYDFRAQLLAESMMGDPEFAAMGRTERRKRVNQAARSCLPNETEAPIVLTGNMRTHRHILENRASRHAEIEIRRAWDGIYRALAIVAGTLVDDYDVASLADGSEEISTRWAKI